MDRMAQAFDICIRGAGIVGRSLALQLASKRLRVALVETKSEVTRTNTTSEPIADSHSDVRAYALNQSSRELLEGLRCWPDDMHATSVLQMEIFGDSQGSTRFDVEDPSTSALNWIVDVPILEKNLREAVGFQSRIEVVQSPQPATLTVVCEGKVSRTREEFGVEYTTTHYPQWALAARVHCNKPHAQTARQWFTQHEGLGEILALLPMGGAAGNTCALVWSVSPERARTLQALAPAEFLQELGLASHGFLGEMQLTSERNVWPLMHACADHWCGTGVQGSWVLAGDAAHAVHPLAGQGLNLGLGDVADLASRIDNRPFWRSVNDMRLLRPYERARKAEFTLIGSTGDAIQQIFYPSHPAIQALRNWGLQAFENSGPLKSWIAKRAMGHRH
jgi:2-polyprenyl-6-methoxyphenol hydroxylase-like FAD-dependent oxidoreductase